MRKKVGRFFGAADDGTEYEVHVYQNFTDVALPESEHAAWEPGEYEFTTPTGRAVVRIEEGVYLLAESGIVIRSDQPGAV